MKGYSAYPEEKEVLLSPNSKFIVTRASTLEADGFYYVDLLERIDGVVLF